MQQLINNISFASISESLVIIQALAFTIKAIKKEHTKTGCTPTKTTTKEYKK